MNTIRSFISIELPPIIKQDITRLIEEINHKIRGNLSISVDMW